MFTLRPQQILFKQEMRKAFASGARTVLGVMATGGGKSVIAADMVASAVSKGSRVLVVTVRRQIVFQLNEQCQRAGIHTGIVMGNVEGDTEAPVQVASMQTLQSRGFSVVGRPDLIIIDEAHNYFDATKKMITEVWPRAKALGFTATPVGPNGAKLSHFEAMVEPVKNSELIAAGHLLRVHPYLAPSEPDMGGINLKTASNDEIGQRVGSCTIAGDVFKEWEPYSHLQTLVVLPSRAVCNQFHQMAVSRGITAKVVDGTTPQSERNETFSEFKEAECQMLLGVDVVREGLDLPIAQCLIDLQPTHQFRVFLQKIGRIKRTHPGQESAVVIDLAGNLWRHMVHPDQDPPWEELTNENTIEEVNERKAGVRCPKCGSKEIYGPANGIYKCEDCQHTWETKRPWVCPHCKQALAPWQKVIGGICPNCSQKVGMKPVRQIRMTDGSIRTVPADEVKRRKKSKADSEEAAWLKWVFIANGWNRKPDNANKTPKTFTWCKAMFQKEQGRWPRDGLKYMPENGSADWKRTPAAVFPYLGKGRNS